MGLRWLVRRIGRKCRHSPWSLSIIQKKLYRWCSSFAACFCSTACSPCLMLTLVVAISFAVLLGHIMLIYWNVKNGIPNGKIGSSIGVDGILDVSADEEDEVDNEADQKRAMQELDSQLYSLIVQRAPNLDHNRRIVNARRAYIRTLRWFEQSRELSRRVLTSTSSTGITSSSIDFHAYHSQNNESRHEFYDSDRVTADSEKALSARYRYCPFVPPAFNYDVSSLTHVHDFLRVRSFSNVTAALEVINSMPHYFSLTRQLLGAANNMVNERLRVNLHEPQARHANRSVPSLAENELTSDLVARINHFGVPFWSGWLHGDPNATSSRPMITGALCAKRHRVAIIIPYRDRAEHLFVLLAHLHVLLSKQLIDFSVFVIEQFGTGQFNKARVMNAGFLEVIRRARFDCYVFHDVDLVPEDDRILYSCAVHPKHLTVAIDEMDYKLAYPELVGGALVFTEDHFLAVNGYSNMFWGWGAEDDDEAYRILHVGLRILRPSARIARYTMLKHEKRKPADWRRRTKLLHLSTRRYMLDGLNNLNYVVKGYNHYPLYTHIVVDIDPPAASQS